MPPAYIVMKHSLVRTPSDVSSVCYRFSMYFQIHAAIAATTSKGSAIRNKTHATFATIEINTIISISATSMLITAFITY